LSSNNKIIQENIVAFCIFITYKSLISHWPN